MLALSPLIFAVTNLSVTSNTYLKWMLVMCSCYMVGKSVKGTTIGGIFCAGGDSKFGFLCDTVTMWCITVPLVPLTAFMLKLPVLAVYFIVNLDEIVKLPAVHRHYKNINGSKILLWIAECDKMSMPGCILLDTDETVKNSAICRYCKIWSVWNFRLKGRKDMFADYHVHTEFSDDSVYPMEQVVRDAIARGMDEICFTDHVDYGIKQDWDCGKPILYRGEEPLANVDYPVYIARIKELQEIYREKIRIRIGIEFGMQVHTIPSYRALFQKYPFDFVILSVHQVDDREFWTQDFQRGKSQKEYNEKYYEEMLNVIRKYRDYSVLGHMDLIARYDEKGEYPFEKVKPVISEILRTVISDGRGIEFNTSYHRYGLKNTTPSVNILKLYRELGGEIITIGSDSHKAEHLGAYIKEAGHLLKELGFQYFCTYEKQQPIFHRL